ELELGRKRERNVEPIGRQKAVRAVGPFEQHHRALGQVVEAELGELGGARQAGEGGGWPRENWRARGRVQAGRGGGGPQRWGGRDRGGAWDGGWSGPPRDRPRA